MAAQNNHHWLTRLGSHTQCLLQQFIKGSGVLKIKITTTHTQTLKNNLSRLKKFSGKKRWEIKYMDRLTNRREELKTRVNKMFR